MDIDHAAQLLEAARRTLISGRELHDEQTARACALIYVALAVRQLAPDQS